MKIEPTGYRYEASRPVFLTVSFLLHAASSIAFFSMRESIPLPASWSTGVTFGACTAHVKKILNIFLWS